MTNSPDPAQQELNLKDVVEDENDEGEPFDQPWDPGLIRVDPKTFSLKNVLDMIDDGTLKLDPEFQRRRVWSREQQTGLIESILLRIPLPAFYFDSDETGFMQVVDGLQRLSAIRDFAQNKFKLTHLEYLEDRIGGSFFKDLAEPIWSRRFFQTQIFVNVIDPQTPAQVKFNIFKRINTGGTPLNAQEIRYAMSKQRSRDFLSSLVSLTEFHQATDGALEKNQRMVDLEVALRFCAFTCLGDVSKYSAGSMSAFLTEANASIDTSLSDAELRKLKELFRRAMSNANLLFGKYAFRKWPPGDERRRPLNRAVFESWAVPLAEYDWSDLSPKRDRIVILARRSMEKGTPYTDATSLSTGSRKKVVERFGTVRDILNRALE